MKKVLVLMACWLFVATTVSAYEVVPTVVEKPYEPVTIAADEYNQEMHLGTLDDFPIMYEFASADPFALSLQLITVAGRIPDGMKPSLMIVRVNDDGSGVTEVARLVGNESDWQTRKDKVFGLTFIESETIPLEYEPGTYRVEVSTPVNEGPFMLAVGSSSDHVGYFETLGQVRTIQSHFGYSVVRMLMSSYVYYPLGIFFLVWVIRRTWKFRNSISHVA